MVIRWICASVRTGVSWGELEETWWAVFAGRLLFAEGCGLLVSGLGGSTSGKGTEGAEGQLIWVAKGTAGAGTEAEAGSGAGGTGEGTKEEPEGLNEGNFWRGRAGVVSGLKINAGFGGVSQRPASNKVLAKVFYRGGNSSNQLNIVKVSFSLYHIS